MDTFGVLCVIFALQFTVFGSLAAFLHWRRKLANSRRPVQDRLLRGPGESLGREVDKMNDKLLMWVALFSFLPVLFAVHGSKLHWQWTILLALICLAGVIVPMWYTAERSARAQLGFMGERAVGEELNALMLDGCRVFHDYPASSKWNIDHVLVAPSGVFAVETKTRRKRRAPPGMEDHKIIFDGKTLRCPHYSSSDPLQQARRNAVWLGRELSRVTAEPVGVKPIVTFPGWWVERTGKSDVAVLNPKEIRSLIFASGQRRLTSERIERISAWLGEKCRDVEF